MRRTELGRNMAIVFDVRVPGLLIAVNQKNAGLRVEFDLMVRFPFFVRDVIIQQAS